MWLKAQSMGFISPPKAMESLMVAGRLASFIDAWKVLTRDFWVLETIKGYQIPFKGMPVQAQRPPKAKFSKEQEVLGRLPSQEGRNPTLIKRLYQQRWMGAVVPVHQVLRCCDVQIGHCLLTLSLCGSSCLWKRGAISYKSHHLISRIQSWQIRF